MRAINNTKEQTLAPMHRKMVFLIEIQIIYEDEEFCHFEI